MAGKRFGLGLLVGVVLALAVVASAGLSYGTFGSFSASNAQLTEKGQTTTTVTSSSTTTTMGTSSGSSPPPVTIGTNSTTAGAQYGPQSNVQNAAPLDALYSSLSNGSTAGVEASQRNVLTSGPASVPLLAFIPVVLALVLGLVLYRSSTSKLARD
ncbi:MAG: hypothetical protein OK438_05720 [Thaumarchaeota archaeon]|nr:hypothetical protein [Nitrososphaerota archaeon]